jgi:hypothetical protein
LIGFWNQDDFCHIDAIREAAIGKELLNRLAYLLSQQGPVSLEKSGW